MSEHIFDAATRRVSAVSRRGSLAILGGVALAALTDPVITSAGKASKKSRKTCARQKQQCRTFYQTFCRGNPLCEEDHFGCCEFLSSCNASGYLQCYHAIV
jgi:hypothetical protein